MVDDGFGKVSVLFPAVAAEAILPESPVEPASVRHGRRIAFARQLYRGIQLQDLRLQGLRLQRVTSLVPLFWLLRSLAYNVPTLLRHSTTYSYPVSYAITLSVYVAKKLSLFARFALVEDANCTIQPRSKTA